MKDIEFELFPEVRDVAFPMHIVKSREELLKILLVTIRNSVVARPLSGGHVETKFVFYVDKMQRVFYFLDDKFYSLALPFCINVDGDQIHFYWDRKELTSQNFSEIMQWLEMLQSHPLDFLEKVMQEDRTKNIWSIIKHMMTYELGYVRFDVDPLNHDIATTKGTPRNHPLYHLDCGYSAAATYKIGMTKAIKSHQMIEILDNTRARWILSAPPPQKKTK